eukprot:gb/GEZN01004573.1/.p1 GENE.gb/GEZN01004573.1/~~gb/GEZN01004573.1/.p1  ORF type:complete len:596 (+),score=106.39 gb/GEZN01004573.1/:123-1910(+)
MSWSPGRAIICWLCFVCFCDVVWCFAVINTIARADGSSSFGDPDSGISAICQGSGLTAFLSPLSLSLLPSLLSHSSNTSLLLESVPLPFPPYPAAFCLHLAPSFFVANQHGVLYAFDTKSGAWSTVTNLPSGGGISVAESDGNYVYFNADQARLLQYDVHSWNLLASLKLTKRPGWRIADILWADAYVPGRLFVLANNSTHSALVEVQNNNKSNTGLKLWVWWDLPRDICRIGSNLGTFSDSGVFVSILCNSGTLLLDVGLQPANTSTPLLVSSLSFGTDQVLVPGCTGWNLAFGLVPGNDPINASWIVVTTEPLRKKSHSNIAAYSSSSSSSPPSSFSSLSLPFFFDSFFPFYFSSPSRRSPPFASSLSSHLSSSSRDISTSPAYPFFSYAASSFGLHACLIDPERKLVYVAGAFVDSQDKFANVLVLSLAEEDMMSSLWSWYHVALFSLGAGVCIFLNCVVALRCCACKGAKEGGQHEGEEEIAYVHHLLQTHNNIQEAAALFSDELFDAPDVPDCRERGTFESKDLTQPSQFGEAASVQYEQHFPLEGVDDVLLSSTVPSRQGVESGRRQLQQDTLTTRVIMPRSNSFNVLA